LKCFNDRDGKYPAMFDTILAGAWISVVLSGVRVPRMNAVMERWVRTCRRKLLDRTLILNQRHLLHALHEYEVFYNTRRAHQGIADARPLVPFPQPTPTRTGSPNLSIHRHDRLGGILHEYGHAARPARMAFSAGTRVDLMHQTDERIEVAQLRAAARIFAAIPRHLVASERR
jgi:hypothetical protein